MQQSPKISSHSQFQPLQEVWIGGTYPEKFYSHFDAKSQDIFGRITEITHDDFSKLEKILRDLEITVMKPQFDRVDDYLDENDNLLKPPISPCDFALTLGDTLHLIPQYYSGINPYQHAVDIYTENQQKVKIIDRSSDPWAWVCFPALVRVGKDIIIDYDPTIPESKTSAFLVAKELSDRYRVHLSSTGDHNDGIFCPVKPGHIFTSHYRKTYAQSFPGWHVFHLPNTTYKNQKSLGVGDKWYIPGIDHGHFNESISRVAEKWLGNPIETVFEVNMLVVNNENIICNGYDEGAWRYFESLGIQPHFVDFKTKMFWDAGIHCVTSDIRRQGDLIDYWPNRETTGVFQISEW